MNCSPCTALTPLSPVGIMNTETAMTTAKRKRIGMPTLASFSMPPEIPRERIQMLMPSVAKKNRKGVIGLWTLLSLRFWYDDRNDDIASGVRASLYAPEIENHA
jgi:hypothetical protein